MCFGPLANNLDKLYDKSTYDIYYNLAVLFKFLRDISPKYRNMQLRF